MAAEVLALHHGRHHQAYVDGLNQALEAQAAAGDLAALLRALEALRFHAGGHFNHSLFWRSLAPAAAPEAALAAAPTLVAALGRLWGSLDCFRAAFAAALLGLRGSGWGWLLSRGPRLRIATGKDQEPPPVDEVPVLAVDMWEHAYYLQVSTTTSPHARPLATTLTWPSRRPVSKRQGGLRRQHLAHHQLEDGRGPFLRPVGPPLTTACRPSGLLPMSAFHFLSPLRRYEPLAEAWTGWNKKG